MHLDLVRRQLGLQPLVLRGPGADADAVGEIAVERNDVPGAMIESVVAETGRAGVLAEVLEVSRRAGRL